MFNYYVSVNQVAIPRQTFGEISPLPFQTSEICPCNFGLFLRSKYSAQISTPQLELVDFVIKSGLFGLVLSWAKYIVSHYSSHANIYTAKNIYFLDALKLERYCIIPVYFVYYKILENE
jgi:hypothetical protein